MTGAGLIKVSRRTTLQWLAAITAGSNMSITCSAMAQTASSQKGQLENAIARGYGTDPDLINPSVPWPRTLTPRQLRVIAVLADLVLPGTSTAPAPSVLGLQDFVDEWVSAPYPQQQTDRKVILEGLKWLEAQSQWRWAEGFLSATDAQRKELINLMVPKSSAEKGPPYIFFRRFRQVIAGAYFTTPEGAKDIGYIGNVPLPGYPMVTDRERIVLDEELRKLGIKAN